MPYIDYKETIPGVKSDFSVMGLDQSQLDIIRTCLNNAMSDLIIRRMDDKNGFALRSKVMALCDLFNDYTMHHQVQHSGKKISNG